MLFAVNLSAFWRMSYCISKSLDNLSLISFLTSRRLSTSLRISVGKIPTGRDASGKSGITSSSSVPSGWIQTSKDEKRMIKSEINFKIVESGIEFLPGNWADERVRSTVVKQMLNSWMMLG